MSFQDNLTDIINTLEQDGVLLHPTDTIWGLACSMNSESAVDKIYKIKNRERNKPLILLVSDHEMLHRYVPEIHPRIDNLLYHFTRPLSVIYKKHTGIPTYLLSEDGSIAIRIVCDDYCKEIINELGHPIVSTSANTAGHPTPQTRNDIESSILKSVDFVSEYRKDEIIDELPSVLISCNKNGKIKFIRS